MRLVIFAWGNPSRGDDALGPAMAVRILDHVEHHSRQSCIEIVEDFQLQVEHALDLEGHDLALFIDASVSCVPPFTFTALEAERDIRHTSHAISPEAVLHVFRQIHGRPAPPSFLLSIRGECFELGEHLGESAKEHLEDAWTLVQELLRGVDGKAWASFVTRDTDSCQNVRAKDAKDASRMVGLAPAFRVSPKNE
jgi:hydrogenase maturation protease